MYVGMNWDIGWDGMSIMYARPWRFIGIYGENIKKSRGLIGISQTPTPPSTSRSAPSCNSGNMNTETSYHKRAEGSFVRDPLKFEAAKQARNAAFRRLIILANLVSTVNTTAYFFSAVGILNYVRLHLRFCVFKRDVRAVLIIVLGLGHCCAPEFLWRCEIFVVHLIKLLAEVFYNKFGYVKAPTFCYH
eukprot:1333499-Amorphochlora_amoeboformis.AAC.2